MENENEQLEHLRHSCAHLLAAAVMELWPQAKRTIGPAIENGFYYDFDFGAVKVSEADLPAVEEKMREIVKSWDGFERIELSAEEAKKAYANNPYKIELINEFSGEGQALTFYKSGSYSDLCRGGHCENPKKVLKHFRLLSVAGAYWRGDEKNSMLTRIYGTAFPTKDALMKHLERLEQARLRDHRKLGKDLDLFVFSDLVGQGLPLYTERGATIRRELERAVIDEEIKRDYKHVYTPDIANVELYRTSGHYPYYKDTMYAPIAVDNDEMMLRPMTCPHHFQLFQSRPRSYRELPLRYAEIAQLYRYEKSGELTGLLRVRSFSLADAHIFVMPDQAKDEIKRVIDLIEYFTKIFGMHSGMDYRYRLSLGDRNDTEKYFKDDALWDKGESILRDVLEELHVPFYEAEKEAAFYGPKIDVQMKNVMGKEETAFTVQYDFCLPQRFKVVYTDASGKEVQPIVVHRSSIGAIERTFAFLIERYAGEFPLWLSPTHVMLVSVGSAHVEFCEQLAQEFRDAGLRVEIDDSNETVGNKIRKAVKMKHPYMLVIGDKEMQSADLMVRTRGEKEAKPVAKDAFIAHVQRLVKEKSLSL
jgi:threonyl-tRNA synthetase